MGGEFNDPRLTILIRAGDFQSSLFQLLPIFRIQSEAAIKRLHRLGSLTGNGSFASWFYGDRHRLSDQRTTQPSDEETGCIRISLCVRRIREPHNVPGVLDYEMLEAPTGTYEGNIIFSCVPNTRERPVEASIGAARAAK
jgi:hypothetical protein